MLKTRYSYKIARCSILVLWATVCSCHFGGLHYVPSTGNIAIGRSITASSTCGESGPEQFCSTSTESCNICNSKDKAYSHLPTDMIDGSASSWWQSESNVDNVTIIIDFEKTFFYTHILVSFRSQRPAAMTIEKSTNGGLSYQPLHSYSSDCEIYFPDFTSCSSQFTHPSPREIVYHAATDDFSEPDLTNVSHVEHFTITNLKIRLTHLHPLSGNHPPSPEAGKWRYYAIDHIEVYGWCYCNGHESGCSQSELEKSIDGMVPSVCQCTNGTTGNNCGECSPKYGNGPWRTGFSPSNGAGCQECQCNQHSNECYYNDSLGHGVCLFCGHSTAGDFCEACAEGHHRNSGVPVTDPNTCSECDCESAGILPGPLCVQEDSLSLPAGSCLCKPNVTGVRCDRCDPEFLTFDPEELTSPCQACSCPGCEPNTGRCPCAPSDTNCCPFDHYFNVTCMSCDCNLVGSLGVCHLNGKCVCKPGVGGAKCDQCLSGYYNLSNEGCTPCKCDIGGSINQSCDPVSGQCHCREDVSGLKCDSCPAGSLGPVPESVRPCIKCFCNGFSKECNSESGWYWAQAEDRFEDSQSASHWASTGEIEYDDEAKQIKVFLPSSFTTRTLRVYLPAAYLGDKRTSYGRYLDMSLGIPYNKDNRLSIEVTQVLRYEPPKKLIKDLQIREDGAIDYRLPLVEEEFNVMQFSYSVNADRAEMQKVLSSIKSIKLRVNFGKAVSADKKYVNISYIKLPYASRDRTHPLLLNPLTAAPVGEECSCDVSRTGSRCDSCSTDYTWDPSYGGEFASCVACVCFHYADTCDPQSGQCVDCRNNTAGTYCERCAPQYYWDPSTLQCRPCNCAGGPGATNQFGVSCSPNSMGGHVCDCPLGFSGDHCETCQAGYAGNPSYENGTCRSCSCNQNSGNGSDHCDDITGDCLCDEGYIGEECEFCDLGYYGNAASHNCTSCGCDRHGSVTSSFCSLITGQCVCQENVTGRDCGQCTPGHWNLASGTGCQECGCSVLGSINPSECNKETGQCDCREGATGRTCEDCQDGYWKTQDGSCSPCDCQPLSSVSPICDKATGVCTCLEGVTGDKCDRCLPSITTGLLPYCEVCDECSTRWNAPIDILGERVEENTARGSNLTVRQVTHTEVQAGRELVDTLRDLLRQIHYLNQTSIIVILRESVANLHLDLVGHVSVVENNLEKFMSVLTELNYTLLRSNELLNRVDLAESDLLFLKSLLSNLSSEISQLVLPGFKNFETLIHEALKSSNKSYLVATGDVTSMVTEAIDNLNKTSVKAKLFEIVSQEVEAQIGKVEERLRAYEDLVQKANERLCGVPQNSSISCDGECGGVTCDECGGSAGCGGSAMSVSVATNISITALREIKRLRENLIQQINDLMQANVTSFKAKISHQRVQEIADIARTSVVNLLSYIQKLKAAVDVLLARMFPDVNEVRVLQNRTLLFALSKTPEEIFVMLNSINSTIDLILMLPDFNETYLRQRAERALSLSNEARTTLEAIVSSIETLKNRLERLNVEKMKVEQGTERTREDLEEIGEMADRVKNTVNMIEVDIAGIRSQVQSLNDSLKIVRKSFETNRQKLSLVRAATERVESKTDQLEQNTTSLPETLSKLNSTSLAKLSISKETQVNVTILRDRLISLKNASHTVMLQARGLLSRQECIFARQSKIREDLPLIEAELKKLHNEIEVLAVNNTVCIDRTRTSKKK